MKPVTNNFAFPSVTLPSRVTVEQANDGKLSSCLHSEWRTLGRTPSVASPGSGTSQRHQRKPLAPSALRPLQDANSHVDNLLVWAHGGGFMLLGQSLEALLRLELSELRFCSPGTHRLFLSRATWQKCRSEGLLHSVGAMSAMSSPRWQSGRNVRSSAQTIGGSVKTEFRR